MSYSYKAGQSYPSTNGAVYHIPKYDDPADAVIAFTDFAESVPISSLVPIKTIDSGNIYAVKPEDGLHLIVLTDSSTPALSPDTSNFSYPEGFTFSFVSINADVSIAGVINASTIPQYQICSVIHLGNGEFLATVNVGP
jgi:hypothetical protein